MSDDRYLVWSIEHAAWWRPGRAGYTRVLADAGRYTLDEAIAIVENANVFRTQCNECVIPEACIQVSHYYILDEHGDPIAVDWPTWAQWFEDVERRVVAQTHVPPYFVSTVFLGLDHRHDDGPPVLWETMVFREGQGFADLDCRRYRSKQSALDGHAAMVAVVEATREQRAR